MQYNLIRYPGCKWHKHLAIVNNPELQAHLPQTDLFSMESFNKFLASFPVVFLKPRLGGGGHGVYKITKLKQGFILYYAIYKRIYINKQQLFNDLVRRCSKRDYIIQQGCDLLQIASRWVDFRIVLFKLHNGWEFMGIMGKCSARNKFVTNQANGGKMIRFKQAIQAGFNYSTEDCVKLENKLKKISLTIAKALNDTFPNITELGLDIAIDSKQHIWLLEANTKPHFNLFKAHEDKSLYGKIMDHTKQLRSLPPSHHPF